MKSTTSSGIFCCRMIFFTVAFTIIYGLPCLVTTNQRLKMMILIIAKKHSQKQQKGKTKEDEKEELLKSIRESDKKYDLNLDKISENLIKLEDAITIIK